MDHHSSFPSDHAALFVALATGIFFISRRLGVLSWVHSLVIVCLPRIYMGVHYPTDILAGAAIGVAIASLAQQRRVRCLLATPALDLSRCQAALFYSCAFVLTSELTVLFTNTRTIGSNVIHAAQRHLELVVVLSLICGSCVLVWLLMYVRRLGIELRGGYWRSGGQRESARAGARKP